MSEFSPTEIGIWIGVVGAAGTIAGAGTARLVHIYQEWRKGNQDLQKSDNDYLFDQYRRLVGELQSQVAQLHRDVGVLKDEHTECVRLHAAAVERGEWQGKEIAALKNELTQIKKRLTKTTYPPRDGAEGGRDDRASEPE